MEHGALGGTPKNEVLQTEYRKGLTQTRHVWDIYLH